MKQYIKVDEWNIIEEDFIPGYNKISESIFSLGNGRMGQRGNFEETYSGERLQGSYVAGIYYPDKTRVGWWKNGYPEYFAKVLNAANWIGLEIRIDGEVLDLHHAEVSDFRRVLNMKEGYLERTFTATLSSGKQVAVRAVRFCSIVDDEAGALRYSITPQNFDGEIEIVSFIDGAIRNQDSNYDEGFWDLVDSKIQDNSAYITLRTRKTGFDVYITSWINVGNGVVVATFNTADKKSQWQAANKLAVINLANKTFKWVTGIPDAASIVDFSMTNYSAKDGTAYIGITTSDNKSAVYKVNATTATATRGVELVGGNITAIQWLPAKK